MGKTHLPLARRLSGAVRPGPSLPPEKEERSLEDETPGLERADASSRRG